LEDLMIDAAIGAVDSIPGRAEKTRSCRRLCVAPCAVLPMKPGQEPLVTVFVTQVGRCSDA
jgi:hypothetical protein